MGKQEGYQSNLGKARVEYGVCGATGTGVCVDRLGIQRVGEDVEPDMDQLPLMTAERQFLDRMSHGVGRYVDIGDGCWTSGQQ